MFAESLSEASDYTSIFDLQEESESIEEEVDLPQWSAFEDDNDLHQAQMKIALEQAKETKGNITIHTRYRADPDSFNQNHPRDEQRLFCLYI